MSKSTEEFAHYAEAERQLCDEAGPILASIIRAVEARAGVLIAEVRVTFDRTSNTGELIAANCTIVRAEMSSASERNIRRQDHSPNQSAAD